MSEMKCRSFGQFMERWECPVNPEEDFSLAGVPATWAPGHPKEWGSETSSFKVKQKETKNQGGARGIASALSDDNKLLAVGTPDGILIYDVESKELRQELEGTGAMFFRPSLSRGTDDGGDGEADATEGGSSRPAYTILAKSALEPGHWSNKGKDLVLWDLDQNGRLLDFDGEAVDASALAADAITAILPTLVHNHEWSQEFVDSSTLHADFENALQRLAASHKQRHNTVFKNADTAGFGGVPFSADGKKLLYHYQNQSTQGGMREPERLPQVVVWDMDSHCELFRLRGHTDAIMWSGFSPNGEYIASVSWDGTMRMYSGRDGQFCWTTPDSGGQSWTGAFSPDSEHIVWSSERGRIVQIHSVASGAVVATFPENKSFRDWCRCIAWRPDSQQLALCVDRQLYVWRPFAASQIAQHYLMPRDEEWSAFASVAAVQWLDQGRKLAAYISDGTVLVYDERTNSKELFGRPKGGSTSGSDSHLFYIPHEEADFYLRADGDGTVRYWRVSVPAYPSWWEKNSGSDNEPSFDGAAGTVGERKGQTGEEAKSVGIEVEENVEEGGWWERYDKEKKERKKPFPETGKYVKITMPKHDAKKETKEKEKEEEWVRKGAELWTAE